MVEIYLNPDGDALGTNTLEGSSDQKAGKVNLMTMQAIHTLLKVCSTTNFK